MCGTRTYACRATQLQGLEGREPVAAVCYSIPVWQGHSEAHAAAHLLRRMHCNSLLLLQGLEGREPVVVIVDDSSAVWPHDKRNLFVVERYIYFPSSRRRFGMQGKSLLEIDR